MVEKEFVECPECAKKPGSPRLCPSCLENRRIIGEYQEMTRAPKTWTKKRYLASFVVMLASGLFGFGFEATAFYAMWVAFILVSVK